MMNFHSVNITLMMFLASSICMPKLLLELCVHNYSSFSFVRKIWYILNMDLTKVIQRKVETKSFENVFGFSKLWIAPYHASLLWNLSAFSVKISQPLRLLQCSQMCYPHWGSKYLHFLCHLHFLMFKKCVEKAMW